ITMITSPKLRATPRWPSCPVFASTTIAPQPAKTRAKVPIASATTARPSSVVSATREQLADQPLDTLVDLVPDPANRLEILAGRVVELPVLVLLAGIDGAGVAAAHRDHGVRDADDLVGERLRELL